MKRDAAPPPQSPQVLAVAAGAQTGALLGAVSAVLALEYATACLRVLSQAQLPDGADPAVAQVIRAAKEGVAAIQRTLTLGIVTPQPGDPGGGLVG